LNYSLLAIHLLTFLTAFLSSFVHNLHRSRPSFIILCMSLCLHSPAYLSPSKTISLTCIMSYISYCHDVAQLHSHSQGLQYRSFILTYMDVRCNISPCSSVFHNRSAVVFQCNKILYMRISLYKGCRVIEWSVNMSPVLQTLCTTFLIISCTTH
jgi:hypothetical protein